MVWQAEIVLAVTPGQWDNFQDGTTQGWSHGAPSQNPPENIPDGGPSGIGDSFLQIQSKGGGGPGSKLVAFNTTQWTGDYIAAGVTVISAHLNNLGDTDLEMRLQLSDPVSFKGKKGFVSKNSIPLPAGSGWTVAVFHIEAGDLIDPTGDGDLSNVPKLWLFHNPSPDNPDSAPPIVATLGVDNITAADKPLSVELSALTATTTIDNVTIKWSTATETNNLGFNIYRSETKDGKYIKLNARLIEGAGTDATPHDYSVTDDNVILGQTYYYYIEDVDFTRHTDKSDIIQVTVGQQTEPVISDRLKMKPVIPDMFTLLQNYPNPFNPDTWIPYKLSKDANVVIRVYNANGKIVRTLHLENQVAGMYTDKGRAAHWDGKNERGDEVASGLYFYTLQAGKFTATKRMVILK